MDTQLGMPPRPTNPSRRRFLFGGWGIVLATSGCLDVAEPDDDPGATDEPLDDGDDW